MSSDEDLAELRSRLAFDRLRKFARGARLKANAAKQSPTRLFGPDGRLLAPIAVAFGANSVTFTAGGPAKPRYKKPSIRLSRFAVVK